MTRASTRPKKQKPIAVSPSASINGENLSDYEMQRLERIKANQAFLISLGLEKPVKKEIVKRILKKRSPKLPRRLSKRIRGLATDGKSIEREEKGKIVVFNGDQQKEIHAARIKKAIRPVSTYGYLTETELALVKTYFQTHTEWMDDFETYLLTTLGNSPSNVSRVIARVRCLLTNGTTYCNWADGVMFGPVSMSNEDMARARERAFDFETKHGVDKGNGWLLNHPLGKLADYQRHVLATLK
jgi:hypothetical protein